MRELIVADAEALPVNINNGGDGSVDVIPVVVSLAILEPSETLLLPTVLVAVDIGVVPVESSLAPPTSTSNPSSVVDSATIKLA